MNPVPRPMVFTAGAALGVVCALGFYLGVRSSWDRPYGNETAATASSPEAALKPTTGAATAVEAKPVQSESPAASSAPAKLAEAKPKPKPSDEDEDEDKIAASNAQAAQAAPEPPPLYSPDEPPAPAPANENNNSPPY